MKKFFYLALVSMLLGACIQAPDKKASINSNVIKVQIDTVKAEEKSVDSLGSLITLSDTVIYEQRGDTTIAIVGNYNTTCFFKPESKYDEDSIDHVYRKTILLLDVCYKDSTILSSIFERKGFQEHLEFPDSTFYRYTRFSVSKEDFKLDKDTLKMEISLCVPDSDLFYSFELSISNNGNLQIEDVTSKYYTDTEDDIWSYKDEQKVDSTFKCN